MSDDDLCKICRTPMKDHPVTRETRLHGIVVTCDGVDGVPKDNNPDA